MSGRYRDRRHAGQVLVEHLAHLASPPPVVLGLVRGGVPVAAEIARVLGVPVEPYLVRKLGVPGHEELAMGAVAADGAVVLNEEVVRRLDIPTDTIDRALGREREHMAGQLARLRGDRPLPPLAGRTVIVVDDGLATGATMRAAVEAVRQQQPERVVTAVPVGAPSTCELIAAEIDELVCPRQPTSFAAVGSWYDNFDQVSDDEVRALVSELAEPDRPDRRGRLGGLGGPQ